MTRLLGIAKKEQEKMPKAKIWCGETSEEPTQPLTRNFVSMRKDSLNPNEPPLPTSQQVIATSMLKPHEHQPMVRSLKVGPEPLDEADMPPILYRKTRDMRPSYINELKS